MKQSAFGLRWRSAAVFDLQDIINAQLNLGEAMGSMVYSGGEIRVLLSIDSTPICRASATRADVFVDVFGSDAASTGSNWASWWAMDGGDDQLPLQSLDRVAHLTEQVDAAQQNMYHVHKCLRRPNLPTQNLGMRLVFF